MSRAITEWMSLCSGARAPPHRGATSDDPISPAQGWKTAAAPAARSTPPPPTRAPRTASTAPPGACRHLPRARAYLRVESVRRSDVPRWTGALGAAVRVRSGEV